MVRGILEKPIVLHTHDNCIIVFPAGSQIDVESDDNWYHDIQDADMDEAVTLID